MLMKMLVVSKKKTERREIKPTADSKSYAKLINLLKFVLQ